MCGPIVDVASRLRVEHGLTAGHRADRLRELGAVHVLADERLGARATSLRGSRAKEESLDWQTAALRHPSG